MDNADLGPNAPTPPIALTDPSAVTARFDSVRVAVPDAVIDRLESTGASVTTDTETLAESSRDWWPLGMIWALDSQVAGLASAVARPTEPAQVGEILAVCNEAQVPVTTAAGRSGVCGASVPAFGGLVLDMGGITGIVDVDDAALTVDVRAGTFGDHFEADLQRGHDLTVGHWPQSMALSTVGGWLACRGAGQYSTRYGKIEDIVVGLDVTLADGRAITTGGQPREAVGPDLNQLFVGSEGTLGVITGARLKAHPVALHERRCAFGFSSFAEGLAACRRVLRRGATPAVLRLYDAVEADRNYQTGDDHVLLVLDEGDHALVDTTIELVAEECMAGHRLDDQLVEAWMGHRNDVSALEKLISRGYVVDTMEIAAPWSKLDGIYERAIDAIGAVPGTLAVSAHQSHAYLDGACLYFTFAGQPDEGGTDLAAREAFYREVWDVGTRAVLAGGGALSHHHGIGLNRSRFVSEALGGAIAVLGSVKQALDPGGILNPGKLGLAGPFGEVGWP